MDEYKRIMRNRELRFLLLRLLRIVPDKPMIRLQYRIKLKKKLNLKNPKRYTEKVQWYKLYYKDPLMTQCVDKYRVRKYIESKGLGAILNVLYQVCDDSKELDFASLPEKFIIKTANGSGTNIICHDKSKLDIGYVYRQLNTFLSMAEAHAGREWAYEGSSKKIIVERLLEDDSNEGKGISDYKFLCFGGEPRFIVYDKDRFSNHVRNFYDTSWNYIEVSSDHPCFGDTVKKPENLDKMLDIARILSADFPAVRVDLYNIKSKIYFGELTFYPWSGYVQFNPDSFDFDLGKYFELPPKKED